MGQEGLKSYQFRKEREESWRALERIVEKVEERGIGVLSARDLARLPVLYRTAVSSLSVARSVSLDQNVLEYLESLAARAYLCVYRPKRSLSTALGMFFGHRFPALVWEVRYFVLFALGLIAAGVACGLLLTLDEPDRFYAFVSDEMAQGRCPTTPSDKLRAVLFQGGDTAGSSLASFAAFLFSHNARVGIASFALGFLGGIPSMMLLFYNGLVLGAVGAVYHRAGLTVEFWAWIAGHGVTELLAVALCGGAGFALARAIIFPGRCGRLHEIADTGRRMASVVLGAIAMFLCAAILEGFFRQIVAETTVRYAMGAATAVFWLGYFAGPWRRTQ